MTSIKIEGAEHLRRKILAYGKAVNKESGEIIEDIAVSGARYLANNTNPFGLSGKTKDVLLKSVYKDMHNSYVMSNVSTHTDTGSHLESLRNRNGRVPNKGNQKYISVESFESIKAEKIKNIGDAKEGWFDSIATLKNKSRIPAWLRKPITLGEVKKTGNGLKTEISLKNTCRYAHKLITQANIQKSLGMAYKNYIKFIDRKMDALSKKI